MSRSKIKRNGGAGQRINAQGGVDAPVSKTKLYLALCFAVPFLLMAFAYAFNGVFPFGDRQILVTDFGSSIFRFIQRFRTSCKQVNLCCIHGIPEWARISGRLRLITMPARLTCCLPLFRLNFCRRRL